MKRTPVVSIVGRTNVGKSTLFNGILKKRQAIVEDVPGVTRDRNYSLVSHYATPFVLVDTGGLAGEEQNPFRLSVRTQTLTAIQESDLVLVVFDGLHGVHPLDQDIVELMRRSGKPVFWVVNKCEKKDTQLSANEFYGLGIEDMSSVSAAHRIGVRELVKKIEALINRPTDIAALEAQDLSAIRVAILGKPNVGKSTLVNRLLGEERVVTSAMPGTTTDSIDSRLTREGQRYILVDTAGLRKMARISANSVEDYASVRAIQALRDADVAILVLNATEGLPTEQDMKIASLVHERGKGLVVVVNKWDAVEKDNKLQKEYERALKEMMAYIGYAPLVFVSALYGTRCPSIIKKIKEVHEASKKEVAQTEFNEYLERLCQKVAPPVYRGGPVKLYGGEQVGVSPPTFVIYSNYPRRVGGSYERYLKNAFRERFDLGGSDIRIFFRKTQKRKSLRNAQSSFDAH